MAAVIMREELINDARNDNPVVGLTRLLSLKDRFKYRLSYVLGRTVIVTQEDDQSLHIYVGLKTNSRSLCDDETREFILNLQDLLQKIARCSNEDPQKKKLAQDQRDVIIKHTFTLTHDTIISLQETFKTHNDKYGALVTQLMGLDDVHKDNDSLINKVGDLIVKLQHHSKSYNGTIKLHDKQDDTFTQQYFELLESARTLLQDCSESHFHLQSLLQSLLGSVFANKLYEHICKLSRPLNAHNTFVRTASDYPVFRTVSIHLGSPPPSTRKAIDTPLKASTILQPAQYVQLRESASPPRDPAPPQGHHTPLKGTMMDMIRSYLPEEDRRLHLLKLQSRTKQATALLIGCVLHGIQVPPGSDTYYVFGFPTCRNEKHVQELADCYRQLLDTSLSPTVVFQSIIKALEHGTLPGLLRNRSGHNLDKTFPVLTQFLTTQSEKRFSVHRLIQFIRDEDKDEPPPCLRRDYGFKLCTQREHVTKLKVLYSDIINKGGPGKLHYACTFGRLLEHAINTLGFVDLSMHRLLQNDYPSPAVGYDNAQGLGNYLKALFKRTKG